MTKCSHVIPDDYRPLMNLRRTQQAIKVLKEAFGTYLDSDLNLLRISAPLFVQDNSGLNDTLNGVERPVEFDVMESFDVCLQIVQSLAKWKRMALKRYGFVAGQGIYTDMNAIRRDEVTDNIHSIYVDQWDWEKVILEGQRNQEFLKETVWQIHNIILKTEETLSKSFSELEPFLPKEVAFVTSQELEDLYPNMSSGMREYMFVREHGAMFVTQIGWPLASGKPHDGRAPDYDDWNLNGDLIYYHPEMDCALEISSMGIRVDEESLARQLEDRGCAQRCSLPFHRALLSGELPLTMGGGIGQSRLSMLLLHKVHIGEVQCSIWPEDFVKMCERRGVNIL